MPDLGDVERRRIRAAFVGDTPEASPSATAASTPTRATSCCGSRPTSTTSSSWPRCWPGWPGAACARADHAGVGGRAHRDRPLRRAGRARRRSARRLAEQAATPLSAGGARARHPRLGGADRARPARRGRMAACGRPSCASWARRSTGSPASTRPTATASRLTERRLLAGAPGTRGELFLRAARKEPRPFLGDTLGVRHPRPAGAADHRGRRADRGRQARAGRRARTSWRGTASTAGSAACTCPAARCRGASARRSRR